MCLNKLDRVFAGKGTRIHTGWKVFDVEGPEQLNFECQGYGDRGFAVPLDRWLIEKHPQKNRTPQYRLGFHIFTERKGAVAWSAGDCAQRIVRVRYRGVLARGTQFWQKTVVARSLYVRSSGRKRRGGR